MRTIGITLAALITGILVGGYLAADRVINASGSQLVTVLIIGLWLGAVIALGASVIVRNWRERGKAGRRRDRPQEIGSHAVLTSHGHNPPAPGGASERRSLPAHDNDNWTISPEEMRSLRREF